MAPHLLPRPARLHPSARVALVTVVVTAVVALLSAVAGCVTDPKSSAGLALPAPLWTLSAPVLTSRILTESNGTLVVASDSLLGYNAVTGAGPAGSRRWGTSIGALALGGVRLPVSGGRVVFSGSALQTLDLANGAVVYSDPPGSTASFGSTDGTNVFVARTAPTHRIESVSPMGVIAWSTPLDSVCTTGCRFAGTAVSGDTVFLAGSLGAATASSTLVMAFNRLTGLSFWRRTDATIDTTVAYPPVVSGKQLVLVGSGGLVAYALNRSTRTVTWQRVVTGTFLNFTPTVAGDVVLLTSDFGGEAIRSDSGTTLWTAASVAPIVQTAACPTSIAIAAVQSLIVVDRITGRLINGLDLASFGGSNGSIGAFNGKLYVSTASAGPRLAAYACP